MIGRMNTKARIDFGVGLVVCATLACKASSSEKSPGPVASAPVTASVAPSVPVDSAPPEASVGGTSIACGTATCPSATEICCNALDSKRFTCKPAPAARDEASLLKACGSRQNIIAFACDDSGDCPGDTICCRPVRHGTDVTYATQECLS